MTVTADSQVEYNGLRLDGNYELQQIDGLAGYPDVRTSDQTLLARHGLHPGTDLLGGRTVNISVVVNGDTSLEFAAAVEALRTAFAPGQTVAMPLTFWLSGVADSATAFINCRTRRTDMPIAQDWWAGYASAEIELFATDPLIYSDTLFSQTTTLPTSPTGLGWPLTWPLTWGTSSSAGSIFVNNTGNFGSAASIRIDGPVTNPRIENVTAGKTIEMDMTIATGDFVMVDTGNRTVLLGGTASRYSDLTNSSRWWEIVPGVNEVTFRANTPTAATMTLETRSAYV